VNGNNPTSIKALEYTAAAFPDGADSLADLKGKTVILKITVDNGSALDVEFKINFE